MSKCLFRVTTKKKKATFQCRYHITPTLRPHHESDSFIKLIIKIDQLENQPFPLTCQIIWSANYHQLSLQLFIKPPCFRKFPNKNMTLLTPHITKILVKTAFLCNKIIKLTAIPWSWGSYSVRQSFMQHVLSKTPFATFFALRPTLLSQTHSWYHPKEPFLTLLPNNYPTETKPPAFMAIKKQIDLFPFPLAFVEAKEIMKSRI